MKKLLLLLTITPLMFFNAKTPSYAQNITTGDATAKASVENKVSGNNNVQTHIEVTANGETKIIDSTGSGTINVEVESNSNDSSNVKENDGKSSTSATTKVNQKIENKSIPDIIIDFCKNIIDRLINIF